MSTQLGPVLPTAATQEGKDGTWDTPSNALLQDGAPTIAPISIDDSRVLVLSGFDFSSIPDGNIIEGIQITVRAQVGDPPPP